MTFRFTSALLSLGLIACQPSYKGAPPIEGALAPDTSDALSLQKSSPSHSSPPTIRSADLEVIEGDHRNPVVALRVTLSQSSHVPIGVSYKTIDGTAKAPGHYSAAKGRLVFAPGELYKNLEIQVYSDTVASGDRFFKVKLYSASNAIVSDSDEYRIDILDDLSDAPSVTGVSVSANLNPSTFVTIDSGDGASQLTNIAIKNTRYIQVNFSTDVDIAKEDLSILNTTQGISYEFTDYFTYDSQNKYAIWEISPAIVSDQITLTLNSNRIRAKLSGVLLDGTWINPLNYDDLKSGSTFPSGGAGPGNNFSFNINFLTCDFDNNNAVDQDDLAELWEKLKVKTYEAALDINQDFTLNELDIKTCEAYLGKKLIQASR